MIQRIEQSVIMNAREIRRIFQISYKIEAELLGAKNFPPLQRPIVQFKESSNDFFGYYAEDKLVAVIEMKAEENSMHIQSLVVDPAHFRKGIANGLIEFVFNYYDISQFTVETGKDNIPARKLYENFGFRFVQTYTAEEQIKKVRYQINALKM